MPNPRTLTSSVLDRIGGTSLLRLDGFAGDRAATILLKLESENPTGSMKDRMALAMIEAAERDGRLVPGQPVVDYTGGSTGVSLAMVCAAKGHRLEIVTSDAFSREKRDHMTALGARLTLIPSDSGKMDAALTRAMIERARAIAERDGAFWTDQLNNADQLAAYRAMAEELWSQTNGRVDGYVQSVGTSASLRGTAEGLRRHQSGLHVTGVEPAESAVLSGGPTGAHKIEGIGAGFVVPLWDGSVVDEIETVSTEEAMIMARRLAAEAGLFAGTSTGANLVAACRLATRLGPEATIVTLMCDSGMKYLSTALYRAA